MRDAAVGSMIGGLIICALSYAVVAQSASQRHPLRSQHPSHQIGLYAGDAPDCAAAGHFVHVYVDRATRRPVPLPEALKAVLRSWVVGPDRATPSARR